MLLNPYKPSIHFIGHQQTVQNQIRCHRMQPLIRISTISLQHVLSKFEYKRKLEDLKVLRRSPDLLNIVKIGQGQLQLIMEQILFNHIWGLQPFWSSDLKNQMNNQSNSQLISEKKMFR